MTTNTHPQVVDFSYIDELSGGKPDFIRQVLTIFMENTPPGLKQLEELIRNTNKRDAISKQMAKEKKDKAEITRLLDEIVHTFSEAEAIINEKLEAASL